MTTSRIAMHGGPEDGRTQVVDGPPPWTWRYPRYTTIDLTTPPDPTATPTFPVAVYQFTGRYSRTDDAWAYAYHGTQEGP